MNDIVLLKLLNVVCLFNVIGYVCLFKKGKKYWIKLGILCSIIGWGKMNIIVF